jgi:hypothetical protein
MGVKLEYFHSLHQKTKKFLQFHTIIKNKTLMVLIN